MDPPGRPPDAEPADQAGKRKRTTADNWPPRVEPEQGQGFGDGANGLVHTMPSPGAMPDVPDQHRRVVRLVSVAGDTDLSIELKPGVNKVGRQPNDNHIVLVGPEISRCHADLIVEDGRIVLKDLGSANGTFVNDVRVQGMQDLVEGDRIQFSDQFRFQLLFGVAADTPDSMTLFQSRDGPLPRTKPPPRDTSNGEVFPTSLRRRSRELRTADAPDETVDDALRPFPEPPPPSSVARPGATRRPDRVPSLRSPADQALMEQISRVIDVEFLGDGPDKVDLAVLERERRQLAVLYQVSKRCMSADGLPELDRLLINVLERIVSFDRGFISYQLPTGDWKLVMSPKGDRWERKVVRSMLRKALKSRSPLLVRNSRSDDSLGAPVPGRSDQRLLLPLVARSSPVGAVFLISSQIDSFDDHTVDFLSLFADIAALAVVNCARLENSR